MSPRPTTRPSCASITNTLRLLCTSRPTYDSIGLPSSLSLGRIATPWSAVDLTAVEGSPPSSIRLLTWLPHAVTGNMSHRPATHPHWSHAMTAPRASTHIGMLLFPNMTQLDFTGPYEVFSRLPETTVHIVAASLDPVRTDRGLVLAPSTTYTTCPPLDGVV